MRSTFLEVLPRAGIAVAVALLAADISLAADVYLQAQEFDKVVGVGDPVPMWGFASCTDATFTVCQVPSATDAPGPQIDATSGDPLTIHLKNTLPTPVSLVIPGQGGGGDPVLVADGLGRSRVQSFTHETLPGQVDTYSWPSLRAGTYLYQSGTHPSIQVPMGLYGALVVETDPPLDGLFVDFFHASFGPHPLQAGYVGVDAVDAGDGTPVPVGGVTIALASAGVEVGGTGLSGRDRGALDASQPLSDLLRDFVFAWGEDLVLTIDGLPAGTYDWTGYFHDNTVDQDNVGNAGVSLSVDGGTTFPYAAPIDHSTTTNPPAVGTQTLHFETDGSAPVVVIISNPDPQPTRTVRPILDGFDLVQACTPAYETADACYDADAVIVFSEIDPLQNVRVAEAAASIGTPAPGCEGLADWAGVGSTADYPCTVDYNPIYSLVNGELSATLPAGDNSGATVLLRLLNAGLRSHVPSIVGLEMGLIAEDGNPYPGLPREQSQALLPAGKTLDAVVEMPAEDVTLALFDRMPMSSNGSQGGGTLANLQVGAGSPPPPAPTVFAVDDVYPVTEDTPLIGAASVLGNDVGLAGATVALVTGPSNGTLVVYFDGTFDYTPNPDFAGFDSFTYSADLAGNGYPAHVSLNVAFSNDAPVAAADGPYVNAIGPDITVAAPGVLGNDSDADGDVLTAVIEGVAPAGLTLNADGSFAYTGGTATTFDYRASDGVELSDPVTVTLDINPVANITLNVEDPLGAPVTEYRWLVQEDATYHVDPGDPDPVGDMQALNFHKSYMPVVAQGCLGAAPTCPSPVPFEDVALDPAKHYYVSVLPNDAGTGEGHTLGGAPIPAPTGGGSFASPVDVIANNQPIPTAQISVLVYEDVMPTNGVPDLNETGLGGFEISLEDAGGRYGQSGGTMSQDAFGEPLKNSLDCFDANYPPPPAGVILTCPDGTALIRDLPPGKYGVFAVASAGTGTWTATSTIEGTKINDVWVQAGEPPFFTEAGAPGFHAFFGFVNPDQLVNPGGANAVSGSVTLIHDGRPPDLTAYDSDSYVGFSHTRAWVGLNSASGTGPNIAAVQADSDGHFELTGIPDGLYQLVVWDTYLDQIITFLTVNLPEDAGDLGNIPVNNWFARLEHNVFLDENGDGVRDEGEPGIPEQAVNLRWRDGTVFQSYPTDTEGFVPFDQVFPFFAWQVAEVDYTRFRATGVTVVVDGGGDVTSGPYPGLLNPQVQADGVSTSRTETEPSPVLLEAFQAFSGQTTTFDWGKAPYLPGENGGISGIVFYGSTRGENDPRLTVGDPWEPGIPGVKVRLYREVATDFEGGTALALVEEVETDSWDASLPTGCLGENLADPFVTDTLGAANATRCFDGWRNWNQVRPGVFDGGYAFGDIPPGHYVVEVVPPPGYELIKEEDKNVDFGDAFETAPVAMLLPGGALLALLPDQAMVLAALAPEPGLAQPPCVGQDHLVPDYLSLFPDPAAGGVETYAPFAGSTRPLCDRKAVVLSDQGQAAADFHLFTSTPVAAQFTGLITDDISNETNPASPNAGEKWTPAFLPYTIRDFRGHILYRGYSDGFGTFSGVLPSTFSANVPIPSGYSPAMAGVCLNDPGTSVPDPTQLSGYGTTCYTLQFMPGTTTYLDTPILPRSAFAAAYNPPDCAYPDLAPAIAFVNVQGQGNVPWTDDTATPGTLLIHAQGPTEVPNPAYEGPLASPPHDQATVMRTYDFGATEGVVTLDGSPLTVALWTSNLIQAELPACAAPPCTGQLSVTRADNFTAATDMVTVTISAETPIRVPGDYATIQEAIDMADPGALILVEPGTYQEIVVMWKPVRLQGAGAASTIIDAVTGPGQVAAWLQKVEDLLAAGDVDLLPGQADSPLEIEVSPVMSALGTEIGAGITVLAKDDGSFGTFPSRIDGFTITGADVGGGIFVNGYAHQLQISNNRVTGNAGLYHGGIRVGHPALPTVGNGPFGYNTGLSIHHNAITLNGALQFQSVGGGLSLCTGTDAYAVSHNLVCGNYTQGDGAGIGHLGLSDDGTIEFNQILFNQSLDVSVDQAGGGIIIEGEAPAPGALTLGTGDVTIDANLIGGNHAGAGHGGGIRAQAVNGVDATGTPWSLAITNNVVVDNVAAWAGGGISLQDAIDVSIVNNTVANNDSTANVGGLIVADVSEPQPAGISADPHSLALADALAQPDGFSNPTLSNNIVWHNRAFHYDGGQDPALQPALAPAAVGECAPGATYWDLGVLGQPLASPTQQLAPTDSILTDTTGYDASNLSGDPDFLSEYCNGSRILSALGPMLATPANGEGGNFIDVRYGPLSLAELGSLALGSVVNLYHIAGASAGIDNGNAVGAPDHDFDGDARPDGAGVDRGADELPEPSGLLVQLAGVAVLTLLARRRSGRRGRGASHPVG